MTKQEIGALLLADDVSHFMSADTKSLYEADWTEAEDSRTAPLWDDQVCVCGYSHWCGRDSHRPEFAIDGETNGTLFFDAAGEVLEDEVLE